MYNPIKRLTLDQAIERGWTIELGPDLDKPGYISGLGYKTATDISTNTYSKEIPHKHDDFVMSSAGAVIYNILIDITDIEAKGI